MIHIINFKASNFRGDCFVDRDFEPYLLRMNEVLKKRNLIWINTSSLRKDANVKGAIVTPAKKSNHMIGHAIDGNILDPKTNILYNSKKLGDGTGIDDECCKEIVEYTSLRWGNAFKVKDSVHFDDALNIRDPKLWEEKYKELHV